MFFVEQKTETRQASITTKSVNTYSWCGGIEMTGVSKRFFIGMAIFAVAAIVYAGTVFLGSQEKTELRAERTEASN